MGRVEQEWQNFITTIFDGQTISKIQYFEMRKAFYGGVVSTLSMFWDIKIRGEDEGREIYEDIKRDLERYKKEIT